VVDLVNLLEIETRNGRQGRIAEHLTRMDFIVLDELGYLPFAQSGGQLLFCSATIWMGIRIAASEIVPEGRFVASCKMLPLAVALLEASRSRSALPNAL
jgi:hypothetical protein